jgi:hypothetical protein
MMQVQAFNCTHANSPVKGRTILKSAAINCGSQVLATILSLDLGPAAGKIQQSGPSSWTASFLPPTVLSLCLGWLRSAAQSCEKQGRNIRARTSPYQSIIRRNWAEADQKTVNGVTRCVPMASDVFFFFARTGRLKGTAGQLERNNPSLNHRQNSFFLCTAANYGCLTSTSNCGRDRFPVHY